MLAGYFYTVMFFHAATIPGGIHFEHNFKRFGPLDHD